MSKKEKKHLETFFSLINQVPVIARNATATTETKLQIVKTLQMNNPALIVDILNRQNISYGV